MAYLGIDSGQSGAIAAVDSEHNILLLFDSVSRPIVCGEFAQVPLLRIRA